MKTKEPSGNFTTDPKCIWCRGSSFIAVPDYNEIGRLHLYERIMSTGWQFAPMKSVYCHSCYCDAPIKRDEVRYSSLLDHVTQVRFGGFSVNERLYLLRHCLEWHLKPSLDAEHVEAMIAGLEL